MFDEIVGARPKFVSWNDLLHGMAPRPNHLYFTSGWQGKTSWVAGKFFEIKRTAIGDYSLSYTLPGNNDYTEIDLSNATSTGENLYPETANQIHEVLIGMKMGNYIVQIDVPNDSPLWKLAESTMFPSKTDAARKYLGAHRPEDSPADNPTLKFWFLKDMEAVILRPLVLPGCDYDKVTFVFKIAKHALKEIPGGSVNQDGTIIPPPSVKQYDTIPFIDEVRGMRW